MLVQLCNHELNPIHHGGGRITQIPQNQTLSLEKLRLFKKHRPFDIGSFYHYEAEFAKCWIIDPLIVNVSWVQTVVRQVLLVVTTLVSIIKI